MRDPPVMSFGCTAANCSLTVFGLLGLILGGLGLLVYFGLRR